MTEISSAAHRSDCRGCGQMRISIGGGLPWDVVHVEKHLSWWRNRMWWWRSKMREESSARTLWTARDRKPIQTRLNKTSNLSEEHRSSSKDRHRTWSHSGVSQTRTQMFARWFSVSLSSAPLKASFSVNRDGHSLPNRINGLQQLSKSHPERSAAIDVSSSLNFSCKDPVEGFRWFIWDSDAHHLDYWTNSQGVGCLLT